MNSKLRKAFLFSSLLVGAGFASAQPPGHQRSMSVAEQALWPAIGLITYGPSPDASICTASLVAPDLILTAAHCVSQEGIAMDPAIIRFSAGARDGGNVASRTGKTIILAKGAEQKTWIMESDMALVVLDSAIDPELVAPLPLQDGSDPRGEAEFIGYRRDARDKAQIAAGCALHRQQPPVFGLGCSVVNGNSGSPVLQRGPEGWQIAGVIISYADGEDGVYALAVVPGDDLRRQIAQH